MRQGRNILVFAVVSSVALNSTHQPLCPIPHSYLQFVDFTRAMSRSSGGYQQQLARFALMALMEVPFQFKAVQELGILG